jgi:hypothetical protein
MVRFGEKICDLDLFNLIDCSYLPESLHVERLSIANTIRGTTCAVFNQQQLALISRSPLISKTPKIAEVLLL